MAEQRPKESASSTATGLESASSTTIREALAFARTLTQPVTRDDDARAIWAEVYPSLSEGRPVLVGALTSRAEAQVLRLSVIYAVMDKSSMVRTEHLMAALAFWDYAEQSARYIFGTASGNPVADRILSALKDAGNAGKTLTDISGLFSRHTVKRNKPPGTGVLHTAARS